LKILFYFLNKFITNNNTLKLIIELFIKNQASF